MAGNEMTYKELEELVLMLPRKELVRLSEILATRLASNAIREASRSYLSKGATHAMEAQIQILLEKLAHLPPERLTEVGDFIEFLHQRELAQLSGRDFAHASENAFAKVWDNDDDALYDKL